MAKTSLVNRNEKRRKTVKKFAAKRAELEAIRLYIQATYTGTTGQQQ